MVHYRERLIGAAKPVDEGFGEGLEDPLSGYFLAPFDFVWGGEHRSCSGADDLEEIKYVAVGETIDAAEPVDVTA